MLVANYSTVRNNLKSYCDMAFDQDETIVVTRQDNKNIVMLSMDRFNEQAQLQRLLIRYIRYPVVIAKRTTRPGASASGAVYRHFCKPTLYARLLAARWAELNGTEDVLKGRTIKEINIP